MAEAKKLYDKALIVQKWIEQFDPDLQNGELAPLPVLSSLHSNLPSLRTSVDFGSQIIDR
jgi:hypothetical protein